MDLRGILYDKGVVSYKLRHGLDWELLARRQGRRGSSDASTSIMPVSLYTGPIFISADKFAHLQDLKSLIPADSHAFYDTLPRS